MAYFTKNSSLAKLQFKFIGGLAKLGLTSLVQYATWCWHCLCIELIDSMNLTDLYMKTKRILMEKSNGHLP